MEHCFTLSVVISIQVRGTKNDSSCAPQQPIAFHKGRYSVELMPKDS